MSQDTHDDSRDPREELEGSPEAEAPREEEPQHPGWVTIAKIFNHPDPFFERILFLLSYEYSGNIYVIRGGDYVSIVDPGNDYTGFMDLFHEGYCHPEDIKKIVLTHGHRDQCSGAFELLRGYPHIFENSGFELLLHKESPQEMKEVVKKFNCKVTELEGGETIDLSGIPLEVMYTPGHTIDGLSFYYAPSKTAFTGDTVLPNGMAETDEKAGGRLNHYLYSLKALMKKDIHHILPGHGVPVVDHGKRLIELTYESLLVQLLGADEQIPWISGAEGLARQGLLEEAVFCCNKALATKPDNLRALQVKAMCLTDLGRGEEALEVLDEILARQPQDPYALTAKGNALLGSGRYEESLDFFDQAIKIAPFIQEAKVYKGMALYLLGRYDEAMDIDIFQQEFSSHLKAELEKLIQGKGSEAGS